MRKHKRHYVRPVLYVSFLFSVYLAIHGCQHDLPGEDPGTLSMFVNQIPFAGLEGLTLHVIRTEAVHTTDLSVRGEIIVLGARRLDLELVGFPSITPKFAASWSGVPPGFILQLRFIVEGATITLQGVEHEVKMPSGQQTGFKVISAETLVEIIDQAETEITVQLDPDESLLNNRGQGFILKPVIKVLSGQVTSLPINLFRPDELIVLFQDTAGEQEMTDLIADADTEVIYRSPYSPFFQLRTLSGTTPDEARVVFKTSAIVVAVEKNAIGYDLGASFVFTDEDPAFDSQWYFENRNPPDTGGDISALEAWGITTGDHDVIIAALDSGFDITHDDIQGRIWVNPGEIADTSNDDDGNGFPDDVNGWNFVDTNNDIDDVHWLSHGTATGSVIAAKGNNLSHIAGVMFDVQLMPVKVSNVTMAGVEEPADVDEAISAWLFGMEYAVNNGAIITNTGLMWIVDSEKAVGYQAMFEDRVGAKGLHFFAAGNESLNIDNDPLFFFPAEMDIPNSIVVTASTPRDERLSGANVGHISVDLAAPGQYIYALSPNNFLSLGSGTSFASPIAAGVAGLVASIRADLRENPLELRSLVMDNVKSLSAFSKTVSGGRIDAFKAVKAALDEIVTTPPQTTLIHPNGLEKWLVGSRAVIRWIPRPGSLAKLKIEYSTDGGANFPNLVVASTPEKDGFFEWTVRGPNLPSKTVRIRLQQIVGDTAGTLVPIAESNADFTISSIVRIMPIGDSITFGNAQVWAPGIGRPCPISVSYSYRSELSSILKTLEEPPGTAFFDFVGTETARPLNDDPFDGDHYSAFARKVAHVVSDVVTPDTITEKLGILALRTPPDGTDEVPHIALIHFGTNDINTATPNFAAIRANLVLLINRLRAANPAMRILIARIIPRAPRFAAFPSVSAANIEGLNAQIAAIPNEVNVPPFTDYPVLLVDPNAHFDQWTLPDFSTWELEGYDQWITDGLHPSLEGDKVIAEKWFDGLAGVFTDLGGLLVDPPGLIQVDENGNKSFTIALRHKPASDVDVEVTWINGDTDLDVEDVEGVSPVDLTFTSADWFTPQTVVVTAADDADSINDSAIFTLTAVDSVTGQRWLAFVRAEEVEDDLLSLVVTIPGPPVGAGELGKPYDPLMVPTSGTAIFKVALSQPADVTVYVTAVVGLNDNPRLGILSGQQLDFVIADGTSSKDVTLHILPQIDSDLCRGFLVTATDLAPVEIMAKQGP